MEVHSPPRYQIGLELVHLVTKASMGSIINPMYHQIFFFNIHFSVIPDAEADFVLLP